MKVVKPQNIQEFEKILAEAKEKKLLVYISAYPCPECEIFEASLEELQVDTSKIIKVDVPNEDWAIEYVLNQLKISGAPTVILPNGKTIDDFDPVEMAKKVKQYLESKG